MDLKNGRTEKEVEFLPELALNHTVIEKIKKEAVPKLKKALGDDLTECVLYGSCARGAFSDDSDIDIALLVGCSRREAEKYSEILAGISTEFAVKYFAVVNFVCIPYEEYVQKKSWYLYYRNISRDGVILYG